MPGHTWGHMVYLVDDEYLFTGDTIWSADPDGLFRRMTDLQAQNAQRRV